VSILTDVAKLPRDPRRIKDDDLIGVRVFARLLGVQVTTFQAELTRTRARRRHDQDHPDEPRQAGRSGRDVPEPDEYAGRTPLWRMATFREFQKNRPGQSATVGKTGPGSRGGRGTGSQVRLPIACPHCHHEITQAQLEAAEAKQRAEFARLRAERVPAADAAARVGISADAARSWEMARRRAGGGAVLEAADSEGAPRRRAVSS
jgi:hypothetical protein